MISTYAADAFRITIWPPTLPKAGEVWIQRVYRVEDEFVYLYSEGEYAEPPEELYLREALDLDTSHDEELVGFVNQWGNVVSPGWEDLVYGPHAPGDNKAARARLDKAVSDRIRQDKARRDLPPSDSLEERNVFHVEEIRLRLARMQNMTRSWDHLSGRIDLRTLQKAWVPSDLDRVPPDSEQCARTLSRNLTAALRPFHIRVFHGPRVPQPFYTTFQAMCLQLVADIDRGGRYGVCKNERCQRLFLRQRGRAEYGQYRSKKVEFCSATCAKAQATRNSRHRKQARELRAKGLSDEQIATKMKRTVSKIKDLLGEGE